jgi:tripartite-type tricarboxylate transporter receptor subunit TctC
MKQSPAAFAMLLAVLCCIAAGARAQVGANVFALAVHRSLPADTLPKFVSFVKARPGQVSYASAGSGTVSHLTMALFMQRAGLDVVHVPYKGGGPAMADAMAGHVALYFGNLSEVIPHAGGTRIRVLAVIGVDAICGTPEEFARTLSADMATWSEAVRISGARIE